MMSAVKLGSKADLEVIHSPVLAVYSSLDGLIDPEQFRSSVAKMSSEFTEEFAVASSTGHPDEHVLLGEVVSSAEVTQEVERAVVDFVRRYTTEDSPPVVVQ